MQKLDQLKKILSHVEEAKSDLDVLDVKDWRFLFAVILSSQTTDVLVNKVTPALFQKFPTLSSFAEADVLDIQEMIKSLSFFRNKSKALKDCAKILLEKHKGLIPSSDKDLLALPGVGRKVMNVIKNCIFDQSGIVTDTHVIRVANRLGWVDSDNPHRVEKALDEWIPKDIQSEASTKIVLFGRYTCIAKKPKCNEGCPLSTTCPSRRL